MAARKINGAWWVDFRYEGERYRRKSPVDNKRGAEEHERKVRTEIQEGTFEREMPTFSEWHEGRYWAEWVVGRKNKAGTVEEKKAMFKNHIEPLFGKLRLDEIDNSVISRFRARLVAQDLKEKSINNILAALSKPLRFAEEVQVIGRAPRINLFRVERPEIDWWEFEEYARLVASAKQEGPEWLVAVLLAGEAGLRAGEIKALRWREDVDLIGGTITVNQQVRKGVLGTPKGRTRRKIPMTPTLLAALKGLDEIRSGYIVRNLDGTSKLDGAFQHALYRICRRAGLREMGWHALRHSFGTHAGLLGVNPWRLQSWMGHKRIDETMRYVHVAGDHMRPLPSSITSAGAAETDPDRRIIRMLGARSQLPIASQNVGIQWASEGGDGEESAVISSS